MRVSDLTRTKPTTASVDLGDGDTIQLTFDRNKVTPAWVTVAQRRDEEQDTLSVPKALADVLLSWDVVNDDGTEFPPTPENIAVFSYPVQTRLLEMVLAAAVPTRAEGNASANTSATAAPDSTSSQVTHQNGLAPSPSLAPSASPSPT